MINIFKNEKAIGYVESIIAIGIAGILLVAVALLVVRVQRATVQNELEDEATQQVSLYLDIARAIKDNAWATDNGLPPDLAAYDICKDSSTNSYFFCDPTFASGEILDLGDETFQRKIDLILHPNKNLVEVVVTVECIKGKCEDVSYTESEALSMNVLPEILGGGAVCGDAFVEGSEECDDGDGNDDNACSNFCTLNPVCGNGVFEGGEECDDGNKVNTDACTNQCETGTPVCGNGIVEVNNNEECDDGNTLNGDNCTSACLDDSASVITLRRTTGDCGNITCPASNPYPVGCQFSFRNTGNKTIVVWWKPGSPRIDYKQGGACANRGNEVAFLSCSNKNTNVILSPANCPSTRPLKFIYTARP